MANAEIKQRLSKIGNVADSPHDQTPENSASVMEDAQAIFTIGLDNKWIGALRRRREAWQANEISLAKLTEETGGLFELPEDLTIMPNVGRGIASAIGSQYVLTYVPKLSIVENSNAAARNILVIARRAGLKIQARRKLLLTPNSK